jgi:hypothetical protein
MSSARSARAIGADPRHHASSPLPPINKYSTAMRTATPFST